MPIWAVKRKGNIGIMQYERKHNSGAERFVLLGENSARVQLYGW